MLAKKIMICYGVSNIQRFRLALSPVPAFVKDSTNSIPVAATWLFVHNTDDKVVSLLMESQTGGLDCWCSCRIRWNSRFWDCLLQLSRERDSRQELFWSGERKPKLTKLQTELILPLIGHLLRRKRGLGLMPRFWILNMWLNDLKVGLRYSENLQNVFFICLDYPHIFSDLKSFKTFKIQNKPAVLLYKPVWTTFTKIFSRSFHLSLLANPNKSSSKHQWKNFFIARDLADMIEVKWPT